MEWKKQTHLASGTREKIPFGIASHMLPGQPPAWQRSLGQGPLGQLSHAWPDALLRPTAKPESNLLRSELSHFSQLCFREVPAFSRNFVTCPQSSHLYSNIGTARSPFRRSIRLDRARHEPIGPELLGAEAAGHIVRLKTIICNTEAEKAPLACEPRP
jgi:hypothetical protein